MYIGLEGSTKTVNNLSGYSLSRMTVEPWTIKENAGVLTLVLRRNSELTGPLKRTG